VLICADTLSDDPVELAGVMARDRARVVAIGAVGLSLPRKVYYEKELTFLNSRSYGPGRYDPLYEEGGVDYPIGYVRWTEGRNLEAFVELMAGGKVDVRPLISHRFPIEQAPEAYALITGQRQEAFLGVALTYPDTPAAEEQAIPPLASPVEAPASYRAAAPSQPVNEIRLGVLGAGNFATAVLLPALKGVPGVRPVGIVSASGASAQHAAGRFGFGYATGDENRILDDAEVNTVAILTRHNLHARQVLAALAAGKHVFCEKPLALNEGELAEIEHVLAVLSEGAPGPRLMVGFNRRFAPLAVQLSGFLAGRAEPLAAHYRVNAGYLPLTHWTQDPYQGGGRIIGEACHFIDLLTYLVGQPPQSVSAWGLPDAGRYREDNVVLTFGFPDGSLGTVSYQANGDKVFPKERLEVFCAGRVAVLDDFRSLETVTGGNRKTTHSRLRQEKGHHQEWLAFARAILAGGPPPIPYTQLFGVTRASFAAVAALRSGQTVRIESGR
jgi:predicted dehydrogenase